MKIEILEVDRNNIKNLDNMLNEILLVIGVDSGMICFRVVFI